VSEGELMLPSPDDEIPCFKCGEFVAGEMAVVTVKLDGDGKPEEFRGLTPIQPDEFVAQGYNFAMICPACNKATVERDIKLVEMLFASGQDDAAVKWMQTDLQTLCDELSQQVAYLEQRLPDSEMLAQVRKTRDDMQQTLREIREIETDEENEV
jgi:hypothetical protein